MWRRLCSADRVKDDGRVPAHLSPVAALSHRDSPTFGAHRIFATTIIRFHALSCRDGATGMIRFRPNRPLPPAQRPCVRGRRGHSPRPTASLSFPRGIS